MRKKNPTNISELPLQSLIGQMIFPRLDATLYYEDEEYSRRIHDLVEQGVGGFCVFKGTMGHVKSMINVLQSIAKIPLLFCADYEYGLPMRLDNGTGFPHAWAFGQCNNLKLTYICASAIAKEAKSIGIDWILAPVCDINNNPNNPIINIRSFGNDIETVEQHSVKYIEGFHSQKVMSCAKHFPGHGDTDIDSHLSLPVLNHSSKRIEEFELQPFINAIKHEVKAIMTGHLSVPVLSSDGLPASLSKAMTTDLLRNNLKFDGIIITDALDMKGLSNYSNEEILIKAVQAGNDILLLPAEPEKAIGIIEIALNDKLIEKKQIIESVERIIKAKEWCGLFDNNPKKEIEIFFAEHERIALKVAYEGLRMFGNENILPFKEYHQIAGFAFMQTDDIDMPSMFFKILAQAVENDCDFGFIDKDIQENDLFSLKHGIKNADIMVFAFFFKPSAFQKLQVPESIMNAYKSLSEGKKTIAVLFGNPYLKDSIEADLIISPFSDSLPSVAATIMKLSGRQANLD
jgi:beta-N-acetylhexosaminidase